MIRIKMKAFDIGLLEYNGAIYGIAVGDEIEVVGIECECDRTDGTFNKAMVRAKHSRGGEVTMSIEHLLALFKIVDYEDYGLLCLLHERVKKESSE